MNLMKFLWPAAPPGPEVLDLSSEVQQEVAERDRLLRIELARQRTLAIRLQSLATEAKQSESSESS